MASKSYQTTETTPHIISSHETEMISVLDTRSTLLLNSLHRWSYLPIGICIGFIFPFMAAYITSRNSALSFWEALKPASDPLMFIIYLAPPILGLIAFYLGRQQDQLQNFNDRLEHKVREKTSEIERHLSRAFEDRERYKRFINLLPYGGIFVSKSQLTLNPKAEEILGFSRMDITTLNDWFRLLFPQDADFQYQAYLDDQQKGFPTPTLVTVNHKSGAQIFLEISRRFDEHGEVWILSNLTHQLEVQSERNINSEILEKTSDGILLLDEKLIVLNQNSASESRSGKLIQESFTCSLPTNKREPFRNQVITELNNQRFWHGQIQLLDSHGDEYPALLRMFAHFDPALQRSFYSALITDLSEIEMERYKSIQTAKLASIGELAAGVGHEINNPLAILRGIYEQCVRLVDRQSPYEKIKFQLEKQEAALTRITTIVDALRIYARGEKIQFQPISIHQGVQDTLNLVESMFKRYEIKIVTDLQAQDDVILGSLGQIQQVLMNLISNARDAMDKSPIKQITIKTKNEGHYFCLSVSDTGQGMDEATKQKMFQPFFTTKERGKGTGMGTSISLGIIRSHNGQFDFTSKLNEGSTFWFKIKNAKFEDAERPAEVIGEAKVIKLTDIAPMKARALIVDDEPEIRDVLRFVLERQGMEVMEALDGIDALHCIEKTKFDVIISDIQMPNLDGIGLLHKLKTDPQFSSKFILITGGIQNHRSTKGQQELLDSIDGFLRKPFNDDDLINMLKNLSLIVPRSIAA